MWYLVGSIVLLGFVAAGLGRYSRRKGIADRNGGDVSRETKRVPEGCCGQHEGCEREHPAAAGGGIVYYDDEELDVYRGLAPEAYSETAADEFREVLYTLKEGEAAGWIRSLQLRGIHLPEALREEALMMIHEMKRE